MVVDSQCIFNDELTWKRVGRGKEYKTKVLAEWSDAKLSLLLEIK